MTDSPGSTDSNGERPLFERIGGAATVDILVDRFYDRMDSLPEARGIRALHDADLVPLREVLKRYLGEWLGGPPLYSAERGHPRLRQRHLHVPIGASERDAWLLCMHGALAETVTDPELRQAIYAAMARLADWMRNRLAEGGDRPGS
ncbi:MAG: group II truncated hemoglobin [Sneathiellaceae bacterium]